jgi:hypothetical protein
VSGSRLPVAVAATAVSASAAVAVWGFIIAPDLQFRWLFLGALFPVLWAYVEVAQVRGSDPEVAGAIMSFHRYVIGFAGLMLAALVGLKLMLHTGLLDPSWLLTVERLRLLAWGGGMVVFRNLLPTLRSPWAFPRQPFAWQQVHRFVGWTFVLGGLGVIGSGAFLPSDSAERIALGIFAIVFTLSLGRKLASVARTSFGSR